MVNVRLAVAAHLLVVLNHAGEPVRSEFLASVLNTDPARVRSLVRLLARAGLVRTVLGPGGGSTLARDAGSITLADVVRAVGPPSLFAVHPASRPRRRWEPDVRGYLKIRLDAARDAALAELARTTIEEVGQGSTTRTASANARAPSGLPLPDSAAARGP